MRSSLLPGGEPPWRLPDKLTRAKKPARRARTGTAVPRRILPPATQVNETDRTAGSIFSMKRVFYILANAFAGVVLVLLLLDPTRPLAPVFVLLALAVVCAVVPRFLR